ncbi:MAG TPA: response regulator [Steroidobacteraceae bacterium]|jgi:FixJ family two-component response regulator|nr:response regulator [Steroidobacteraceae bacterium]
MSTPEPIVFLVDDDDAFREALHRLLRSAGFQVEAFATARGFLAAKRPDLPGCLVLDVQLPGLGGLDLQRELHATGETLPIIFLTGHGDIPMSVHAMKTGAVEFLTKPVAQEDLLRAVGQAVERDAVQRVQHNELVQLRRRYALLTAREREVMERIVVGRLNKQIAAEFGTLESTVKEQRAKVMKKMQVTSLAQLVRIAARLEIS